MTPENLTLAAIILAAVLLAIAITVKGGAA